MALYPQETFLCHNSNDLTLSSQGISSPPHVKLSSIKIKPHSTSYIIIMSFQISTKYASECLRIHFPDSLDLVSSLIYKVWGVA